MAPVLFDRDGEHYIPTRLTAGPWDPQHAHGGAVAALLAQLADSIEPPVPMVASRLTIDLLRPVAQRPLLATTHVPREGRRIQLAEVSLTDLDDRTVARASLLRIREAQPTPALTAALADAAELSTRGPSAGARDLPRFRGNPGWPAGFHEAVDLRVDPAELGQAGGAVAWVALRSPIVEDGLAPTPLARAAAAADFGNGVGAPLPMDRFAYINADITVQLDRNPVGDWIGIVATSLGHPNGVGRTMTTLHDEAGQTGIALQSLLIESTSPDRPSAYGEVERGG